MAVGFSTTNTVARVIAAVNKRIHRVFPTKTAALAAWTTPARQIGMAAYIVAEKTVYRFVDGTLDSDFKPESLKHFRWNNS